ncbi:unnamed protein product [Aphanomyces euteiches]|uniref:Uncharacterized protein n=1 Tax=Aphanomyces euteiches TaxID=100861 RepID=A0A6G0X9E4_9STRA|nr:hypothetical protein Ae201684_007142 [Aphanomyces euteiches]KAH9052494.1 hypothetical protein Ae201684P_001674 [Aphanomyces euteiches]KAH9138615.1 hypothetical protein AeRB84_017074 [Aphanomyces euteiches]
MAARRVASGRESTFMVGGFVVLAGLAMYALPYVVVQAKKGQTTLSKDGPLSTTEIRRGAFLNSGSKDIGPDPDWDHATNTYRGRRTPFPQQTPAPASQSQASE